MIQNLVASASLTAPLPARIYTIRDNRVINAFTLWQNGLDFEARYRYRTDNYGNFNFNLSANQIFRFTQKGGQLGALVDIKDGNNAGRFTGIEMQGRASVGWQLSPYSANVAVNYSHPYHSNVTAFPYNLAGPGRLANFMHVGALVTADVNFAYDLPNDWLSGTLSGTQISLNLRNVLDSTPPFVDNTNGMDVGNQIGRTVEIGLRKKW